MTAHLTHVALFVADVKRTIAFYGRYAGLHVVHERVDDGVHVAWLSEAPRDPEFVIVVITLPPGEQKEPPHFAHFGYDLPSRTAVDELSARAGADGVLVTPAADAGPIVGYTCMLRDPDGNLVEFSHGQSIQPNRRRD